MNMSKKFKGDHKIRNYDAVLDREFGKSCTPKREKSEREALEFYHKQIGVNQEDLQSHNKQQGADEK